MITVLDAITTRLKANLKTSDAKSFYLGDPYLFPKSSLPAICIIPSSTQKLTADTGNDWYIRNIIIRVVYDAENDLGKLPSEVLAYRKLAVIAEGSDSGSVSARSIIGALMTDPATGNKSLNLTSSITMEEPSDVNYDGADPNNAIRITATGQQFLRMVEIRLTTKQKVIRNT